MGNGQQTSTHKYKVAHKYKVGHKIAIKSPKCKGQIKCIIIANNKDKNINNGQITYYGVRLTKPKGNSDGIFQRKRYFKCPPKHAIFITTNQIEKYVSDDFYFMHVCIIYIWSISKLTFSVIIIFRKKNLNQMILMVHIKLEIKYLFQQNIEVKLKDKLNILMTKMIFMEYD